VATTSKPRSRSAALDDRQHLTVVVDGQRAGAARVGRRGQQLLREPGQQAVPVDRLDEVVVGAEREPQLAVVAHRDDEHRDVRDRRVALERPQDLPPVQARQR